jgi:integrase
MTASQHERTLCYIRGSIRSGEGGDRGEQKAAERATAGLRKLNVKALRHSFASALINEGRLVTEVQYLMGHSTHITTLAVYSHFFRARDNRKVAEVIAGIFDGTVSEKNGHSMDPAGLDGVTRR